MAAYAQPQSYGRGRGIPGAPMPGMPPRPMPGMPTIGAPGYPHGMTPPPGGLPPGMGGQVPPQAMRGAPMMRPPPGQ